MKTENLKMKNTKRKSCQLSLTGFSLWRSGRDSNPRYAFDVHTISSRARYDRFDTTPCEIVRAHYPGAADRGRAIKPSYCI